MPRFGSDANSLSQSIVGVTDEAGNALVETSVDFAASPLGVAARAQALFGIPNAQFNLTPPDTSAVLEDYENPLPYWSVENLSDGRLTAYSVFDNATSTWGVELNPSAGSASDSLTLKTRSYLLNDDNLSLRQKAFLTLAKSGTAAVSTQWNVVMTAEYFTADDVSLTGGTAYAIGTALDTATFTTINGFTTSGGTAVGASAAYVDIKITLTCTANVTGTAKATLKSLLLQTSTGAAGAQSFLISQSFTSSTTWTRPTGVDYLVAALVIGGGGGGGGGQANGAAQSSGTTRADGGGGGASGGYYLGQNLFIGSASTLTITVGAGGAGGAGGTSANTGSLANGTAGGVGGASTLLGISAYGTGFVTLNGGGGGAGSLGGASQPPAGGTANNVVTLYIPTSGSVKNDNPGASGGDSRTPTVGGATGGEAFTNFQYINPTIASSSAGGSGTSPGTAAAGGAQGTADPWRGMNASGAGGGGGAVISTTAQVSAGGSAEANAKTPAGLGGGGAARYFTTAGTVNVTGGNGSNAVWYGAGGGGGGGAARVASTSTVRNNSVGSAIGGNGGNGSNGLVVIWYVG